MMQQQVPYNLFQERPIVEIKVQVLRGKARELLLRIENEYHPFIQIWVFWECLVFIIKSFKIFRRSSNIEFHLVKHTANHGVPMIELWKKECAPYWYRYRNYQFF